MLEWCVLWSWPAGAAAGCRCRVPLQGMLQVLLLEWCESCRCRVSAACFFRVLLSECWCRCRGLLRDVHGSVGHWGLLEIMFTQCQRESVWLLPKNILCYLGSMRNNFRQNHVEAAFDTSRTGHRTELWPHQLRVTWQDSSPERKQEDKKNRTVQTNGHQRFGTWEWCMFQKWGFHVI